MFLMFAGLLLGFLTLGDIFGTEIRVLGVGEPGLEAFTWRISIT